MPDADVPPPVGLDVAARRALKAQEGLRGFREAEARARAEFGVGVAQVFLVAVDRGVEPRRRFDVAYGIRRADDLAIVVAFFEARNGRLHGFRFKDWADHKSCMPSGTPSPTDRAPKCYPRAPRSL